MSDLNHFNSARAAAPCGAGSSRAAVQPLLFSAQDSGYGDFHAALVPGFDRSRIIGVRMPQLRRIAKDLAAGKLRSDSGGSVATGTPLHWQAYFTEVEAAYGHLKSAPGSDAATPLYYEEILAAGLALAYAKLPLEERFARIRRFVPMIDNWAVCDSFCGTWKPKESELPQLWDFLVSEYLTELCGTESGDAAASGASEYDLRYGVVMLLTHFIKREEYIDRILTICNEICHPAYYVKMAVAWCLSYGFMFFPARTLALFQSADCRLDDFTCNKSIQKACESFRVPKEFKEFLKTLRR